MSMSVVMQSDPVEGGRAYPSLGLGNSFAFKFEDLRGRVHRFTFGKFYFFHVTLIFLI